MTKGHFLLRTFPLIALAAVVTSVGMERAAVAQYFAFQDSSNELRVYNWQNQTVTVNGPAMKSGTTPSQAIIVNGQYYVAYQGSNGHLWVDSFNSAFHDSGVAMAPGTSPSYTILPGPHGAYTAFAFQGSNGHLWVSPQGSIIGSQDTGRAMASGTSPSIAGLPGANYVLAIAYQGSNGHLVVSMTGTTGFVDTGNQMAGGTSPSIAGLTSSSIAWAFHGNDGTVHIGEGNGEGNGFYLQSMISGTSPSVIVDMYGAFYTDFWLSGSSSCIGDIEWGSDFQDNTIFPYGGRSPVLFPTGDSTYTYAIAVRGSNGHLTVDFGDTGIGMN